LPTEEGSPTAKAFVSHRLNSAEYRRLNQAAPALPLFRRWERDLNPGSKTILPEGEPPGPKLATVLVDERGLVSLDPATGEARWQKPVNNPILWAGYGPMPLVVGTRNSLMALALETGRTLWRVSLEESEDGPSRAPAFRLVGDQVLVLGENQLGSYEAGSGRAVWNLSPSGRFSNTWLADEDFIVVETENPLRVLILETKSGRRLSEHRPPEPWLSPPVPIQSSGSSQTNRGFIAAMANRRIHTFGASDRLADPMWTFRGATSFANSPPRFWSEGESLLMLMDGDTLVRLAPETGETLWFFPLSLSPSPDPTGCIVLENDRIYAADDKTLYCLDFQDGRVKWKQPLPQSDTWALRKRGSFLFAFPGSSEAREAQAILFRADTGDAVQKLNLPADVAEMVFQPTWSLAVTRGKLMGWGAMAQEAN
jgi:outer membrane protein assembly factor BamB